MNLILFYTFVSVLAVSLISLIGVVTISVTIKKLKTFLLYMVSFAAGALMGDVFLHLLPEAVAENGFSLSVSLSVLAGIVTMFFVEKVVRWHHCHHAHEDHVHPVAVMNLVGDAVHNFIDGIVIAISYVVSIPVGIATTLAVALHEIPQEIGDFGVLVHGGFSKKKALFYNFLSALIAVIGAAFALILATRVNGIVELIVPFAAGSFIYIAGADLIPELHHHESVKKSVMQFLAFVAGIVIMWGLLGLEGETGHSHDEVMSHESEHIEQHDEHNSSEEEHDHEHEESSVRSLFRSIPMN